MLLLGAVKGYSCSVLDSLTKEQTSHGRKEKVDRFPITL